MAAWMRRVHYRHGRLGSIHALRSTAPPCVLLAMCEHGTEISYTFCSSYPLDPVEAGRQTPTVPVPLTIIASESHSCLWEQ
jgi:hypothetical protein